MFIALEMGLLLVSFATFWKSLDTFKACPHTGTDGSSGVTPGKPTVGTPAGSALSCLRLSQLRGLVHCICRTGAGGRSPTQRAPLHRVPGYPA